MPDIKKDIQKALFEEASQLTGGRFVDQSYKNIVAEVISIAKATKEGSYIKITKRIISNIDLQKKAKEFEESKTREQQDEFLQKIIQPQLDTEQHTSNEDLALIKRNLHDFFSQAVYIISDKENLDKINTKTKEEEGKTNRFTFSPPLRGQENASNKEQQLKGLKVEFTEHLGKTQNASKNFLKELETLKTPSDLPLDPSYIYIDPISPLLEKEKVKDAISGLSGKKLTESEISKSIRSKDLGITSEEANDIRNFLQSPAIREKIQRNDLNSLAKDIKDSLDKNDLISKISGEKYQLEFSKNNFTNFLNEKIISSSISFKHEQAKIATTKTDYINNKKLEKLIKNPDDLTNLRRFIRTHAQNKKNEQVLAFLDAQNPLVEQAKAAVEQVIEDWGITYEDRLLTTAQNADLNPKKEDNKEIAPLKPPRTPGSTRPTVNKFVKYALLAGAASQFPTAFAGNLRGVDEDPTEELHRRAQDNSYSHEYAMNDGNSLFLVSGENNRLYRGESAPEQVATLDNAIRTVISFNSNSNTLLYNDYSGQFRSISIGSLTFVDINTGQTTVVATTAEPEKSTTTTTSITPTSTTPTSTTLTSTTTTTTTPTTTGTGTTTTSTTTITTTPESEYNLVDGIPTLTCRGGSNQDSCRLEFSDGGWKVYVKNNENGIDIPANSNVNFNGERLTIKCPGEQQPYQLSLNNGDITQISCGENKINVNPDDDVQFVNQNGVTVAQVTTSTTTPQSSITSTTTTQSSSTSTTTFSSSFTNVNASTTNANGDNSTVTATTTPDGTRVNASTTTQDGTTTTATAAPDGTTTVATTTPDGTTTTATTPPGNAANPIAAAGPAVEEVNASAFTPISPNSFLTNWYLSAQQHNKGEGRLLSEDRSEDNNKGTDNTLAWTTAANVFLSIVSIIHTARKQVDQKDSDDTQRGKYKKQILAEIPQIIAGGIVGAALINSIDGDLNNTQKSLLIASSVGMQLFNSIDDILKIYKDPSKKTDLDTLRCTAKFDWEDGKNFWNMLTQITGVRSVSTPIEHGLEAIYHAYMRNKSTTPTKDFGEEAPSEGSLDVVNPETIGKPTLPKSSSSDGAKPNVFGKKTPSESSSEKDTLPGNITRKGSDKSSSKKTTPKDEPSQTSEKDALPSVPPSKGTPSLTPQRSIKDDGQVPNVLDVGEVVGEIVEEWDKNSGDPSNPSAPAPASKHKPAAPEGDPAALGNAPGINDDGQSSNPAAPAPASEHKPTAPKDKPTALEVDSDDLGNTPASQSGSNGDGQSSSGSVRSSSNGGQSPSVFNVEEIINKVTDNAIDGYAKESGAPSSHLAQSSIQSSKSAALGNTPASQSGSNDGGKSSSSFDVREMIDKTVEQHAKDSGDSPSGYPQDPSTPKNKNFKSM